MSTLSRRKSTLSRRKGTLNACVGVSRPPHQEKLGDGNLALKKPSA
jgi:hypothetical protein